MNIRKMKTNDREAIAILCAMFGMCAMFGSLTIQPMAYVVLCVLSGCLLAMIGVYLIPNATEQRRVQS